VSGTEVRDGALLTVRMARKRHWCERGRHWIEPGERYEDWRVPPWRGGNESPSWWHGKRHSDQDYPCGWACAEAEAYREHARRLAQMSPEVTR
jgi:hypothetical protein